MDGSFKPLNLFNNTDDERYDVQEAADEEKGRVDGIVVLVKLLGVADLPLEIELDGDWSDSSSETDTPLPNYYRRTSTELDNDLSDSLGDGNLQLQTPMHTTATTNQSNQSTLDDAEGASSEESLYESVHSDTHASPARTYKMGADDPPVDSLDNQDLARSLPGFYRILDLVTEQGSGGLVDKIIISQNSLKAFVNAISPGAYASMTKVNFKMLDQSTIKPVGIYGSKEEIVRFLLRLRIVDETIAIHLLSEPSATETSLTLRPGLYLLRTTPAEPNGSEQVYVIYWPEQNTWDDSASSQVRRNRVAFMRYLTRMCDQIVALVSSEHARRMVWSDVGDGDEDDEDCIDEDDEGDRIIRCVVQRTTEQEESVQVRDGFKMASEHISQMEPSECREKCPINPFLLSGETAQGFVTVEHQPPRRVHETFEGCSFSDIQLQDYLTSDSLDLSESLDEQGLLTLVHVGLEKRFPQESANWKHESTAIQERYKKILDEKLRKAKDQLAKAAESLSSAVHNAVVDYVVASYPFIDKQAFQCASTGTEDQPGLFCNFGFEFKDTKARLCLLVELISRTRGLDSRIRDPILLATLNGGLREAEKVAKSFGTAPQTDTYSIEGVLQEAQKAALKNHRQRDISEFVAEKKNFRTKPHLVQLVESGKRKIEHVNNSSTLVQFQKEKKSWARSRTYKLWGLRESEEDPTTCYTVYPMNVTEEDKHNLQLDPSSIPSPRVRFRHPFQLPLGHIILRAQLLEGEKLLLIVADRVGNISVYLETLTAMRGAIQRERCKLLKREKIGQDFHLAFDESKRMLGVVSSDKLLHVFVYDDARGFQAQGSAVNLSTWYGEGVLIHHACFICGSEEMLLVDSQAQARIFSMVTMQFRPAVLNLPQIPIAVHCTPDGSCILAVHSREPELAITAYHWSSFGSTEGITLNIPDLSVGEPLVVTSLIRRTAVHLLKLDLPARRCQSYALDITRRHTEFMFRERVNRSSTSKRAHDTAHNCLIDCHSEVWTRFPVWAAVQRETISSASLRSQSSLMFVTDRDFDMFAPHFSQMIHSFERTTRKPTGNVLKSVKVSATSFDPFAQELCGATSWSVSQYRAGEWVVNFLCLIPIHIAVTKDNRFIPLKDGVYSPSLERELLGAGINRIVDSISFGWYESLFQSYMATKPVRVVSSMGEQSVGKSYALNHLVDTSFAGSAMRTTEGVWMSVTPTEKELIVALDFEDCSRVGVHSIERSAQEDTLLVLFNTAISNLVLFRNNFALSRDITGLFQSFQSSATVLDPKENPSLFQSTLVIIIKDVVEADKVEIGREFSLKFEKIVQDEQEANFITRLHAGKLNIIPWPVIESKEFYKLFTKVKRCLDQQPVTHPTAGEFLHEMKTLMAKLKANDWGAMSQTMASHRAQLLLSMLPNALMYGLQEIEPEPEPLRNIDTDIPIQFPDTSLQFFLAVGGFSQSETREQALTALRNSWDQHETRQHLPDLEWADSLSEYLEQIINLRIDHTGHASIEELRRTFENATVDLRSNVQFCRLQCASCQLLCIQSRFHDGPHHCRTDHVCIHQCDFCKESTGESRACSMIGGHAGKHIRLPITRTNIYVLPKYTDAESLVICVGSSSPTDRYMHALEPVAYQGMATSAGGSYMEAYVLPAMLLIFVIVAKLVSALLHSSEEHLCSVDCSVPGICEIETAPYSIEATFTGRHETFQYTKLPNGSNAPSLFHLGKQSMMVNTIIVLIRKLSISAKIVDMNNLPDVRIAVTSAYYHLQEHETRHGSMSRTRWVVDEPDDAAALEVEGRKFSTNDEGAPMMCNLVCQAMGRHVHIDYCRADDPVACTGREEVQHVAKRLLPDPDRPKDYITHNLFWKKSGFKDPYSKEEQANFAKCDAMCSGLWAISRDHEAGPEHAGDAGTLPQPSYCTLPMFHRPSDPHGAAPAIGHISNDGHHFTCRNPVVMQQAYHVIFVADRSGSMSSKDKKPLPNTPASGRISSRSNNRFGAVLSSLYGFWSARAAAIGSSANAARRDAYSVILFNSHVVPVIENDFTSNPDQLLDAVLPHAANGGTNFTAAITNAAGVMERHWSTERSPVIVFLSDGECQIADQTMQDLCCTSGRLGKALSFHAVSFGRDSQNAGSSNHRQNVSSTSLRRMVEIAQDAQNNAPRDPLAPAAVTVLSSYTDALDTVQLAETFLGIAESLRKPRGSLMQLNSRRT
ncbi:hypothetical protein EDD16DRAFT_1526092 [Pisolithus croceorrhizus]|nr:hypothetical protein EDD16DRAFT_1526092 [Pisolithus croceorrhizus]